ncbi:hypothetical protein LCI18_002864 [Fusarium solani-melongenae]|uniref:Uncharacterized protein n=1 Tax=Fusarium solani subsp. cucurbitae TaxID=2747967 RepID=A0ACD3YSL5_FUSSC|nr:hypothetical protein LCI18_002864 [Fusarium solani-melongenae]
MDSNKTAQATDEPISSIEDASLEEKLKIQIETPNITVGFKDLFRYATLKDLLILTFCTVAAIAAGAILPCFPLLFGDMAGLFQSISLQEMPRSEFDRILTQKSLTLVYLGIGAYVATYISTVGFMGVGERLTRTIRQRYFRALLRQNMAFFDNVGPGMLSSRISLDCQNIQEGVSEKVAFVITALATLVSAYVIGFIKYWKLTLVASSILVGIIVTSTACTRFIIKYQGKSMANYSIAGGLAEEVISSIRTVKALGVRDVFALKFESHLTSVETWGRKAQICVAVLIAIVTTMTFMSHALTFWTGSIFIGRGEASTSDVITVAFAILIGSHVLGGIAPHIPAFAGAIVAASKVYSVIDRESPLDPTSEEGVKFDQISGSIEFVNVKHIYPARPQQVIMDGVNLHIPAGKTTAIVGPSGSGKSTVISLIERFYSPISGQVICDGKDISTLNLRWFRQKLALVAQEPVLFAASIFDNIAMGALDIPDQVEEKVQSLEFRVDEAAKQANAHNFITNLPKGYDTKLGEGGSQLSGGQKQRIAIARALIRNPAVLLLDEATSALDSESEQTVKEAIQSASVGRTTIVVSHRLSTITYADNIIVLSEGRVVEQGTHSELQSLNGVYSKLFEVQQLEHPSSHGVNSTAFESAQDQPLPHQMDDARHNTEIIPLDQEEQKAQNAKTSLWSLVSLTASFNCPEAKLLVIGLTFSILAGCGGPTLAFLLAKAINELSKPDTMVSSMREGANFWCLMMFVVGLIHVFNLTIQGVSFAICSERLIYRARSSLFRSIIEKDVSFFDRDENKTGALTPLLGIEAKSLSSVSGSTLGTILMSCTTLIASMAIALAIGWKVALVCISTLPVLLGCGFYRVWMIAKFAQRSHEAHKQSSAYASEAVMSARTIAALATEEKFVYHYEQRLKVQERKSLVSILKSSVPYAASQSFAFFCVALAFWYGGQRIADGEYSIFQFFACFSEIIFGSQAAGLVFSFATDIGKAKKAARTFHTMLQKTPTIDGSEGDNSTHLPEKCQGRIEFDDIRFTYPNRPGHPILNGLSFAVQPGEHIALVGSSGCGKSTCFALLERMYDPNSGTVKIDGRDIRELDVAKYRRALAYVSQEPTIYSGTIRDNITLGCGPDETDEAIAQACKDANIYDFISSLPDGLTTTVGNRGVMLSGGQKQRIAIARALIRNPRVLLLDEATSALDSASEKLVQDALEKASRGWTTILVAHRLSFVRNADKIFVMDKGQVVESGTHTELMRMRARYYSLVRAQALEVGSGEID